MALEQIETVERDDPIADVRAAMEQVNNAEPGDAPEPLETAEEKEARSRDDKGRFAKGEKRESKAEAPVATGEEIAATADNSPGNDAAGQTVLSPPKEWSPGAKALLAKLPASLQQEFLAERQSREKEIAEGFAQKSNEARQLKEVEAVIAPRRSTFQKHGFKSDAEAVNHLLLLSDSMERNAPATIAHLAQIYGVDLSQPINGTTNQAQPVPQPQFDPNAISKMVNDQIGMVFARQEVDDFAKDAVKYPHFAALRPVMSQLLLNGQADTMEAAYKKALRLDDTLYQQDVDRQIAERAQKANTTQQDRITKAKTATRASLSGAPHGSAPKPSTSSRDKDDPIADVRAAMEQLGAG